MVSAEASDVADACLQWVENSMVSPERILQYAALEPEAPLHDNLTPTPSDTSAATSVTSIQRPPAAWPQAGAVEFNKVNAWR